MKRQKIPTLTVLTIRYDDDAERHECKLFSDRLQFKPPTTNLERADSGSCVVEPSSVLPTGQHHERDRSQCSNSNRPHQQADIKLTKSRLAANDFRNRVTLSPLALPSNLEETRALFNAQTSRDLLHWNFRID
jgi:hypothetical protein